MLTPMTDVLSRMEDPQADALELSERIDRSLLALHALPELDARAVARAIGVPAISVRTSHWIRRHRSVRASLALIRVAEAERLLREQSTTLLPALAIERTAEAVGFHSPDEMDRAFLRYRHRSSFDALLAARIGLTRAAA